MRQYTNTQHNGLVLSVVLQVHVMYIHVHVHVGCTYMKKTYLVGPDKLCMYTCMYIYLHKL